MSANSKKHQQPPQVGADRSDVYIGAEGVDAVVEDLPEDFEGFEENKQNPKNNPTNISLKPNRELPYFVR